MDLEINGWIFKLTVRPDNFLITALVSSVNTIVCLRRSFSAETLLSLCFLFSLCSSLVTYIPCGHVNRSMWNLPSLSQQRFHKNFHKNHRQSSGSEGEAQHA